MVLSIINEKGGSGKTTLAINLSLALANDNLSVTLIDADPQRSTEVFCNNRASSNLPPLFSSICKSGEGLRDEISLQTQRSDVVIIDTGGRDSKEMRISMTKADIIIIPVVASQYDVAVMDKMLDLYNEAKDLKESLRARILFNRISPNPMLKKDLEEIRAYASESIELKQCNDIKILESILYERRALKKAVEEGKSLDEFGEEKASNDFTLFYQELKKDLK